MSVMQISLYVIAFITPVIVLAGLKHFKHDNIFALKFLSVALVALEIFKFFYNASLFPAHNPSEEARIFPMGDTPAVYIPLTIITLISVIAMFGAFGARKSKSGLHMRYIVALTAFTPLIFTILNASAWYRSTDTLGYLFGYDGVQIGMVGAIYFVQCGLILAYARCVLIERQRIPFVELCSSVVFITIVLGTTALTNHLWASDFIFTSESGENISIIVLCFLSTLAIWGVCNKNSTNTKEAD
ncbi:MAG: hypothetical protein FWC71_04120 [Defluviitaleaceae bacterium]|nr:hypothetical protein [Defluviitaleaceae bacterium]